MGNKPKVSVIIATHNSVDDIGNCIDSVWSREFSDVEVIAVDVNSTDGTKDLLAEFSARDEQVKFLVDSMGSMGHAKNLGLDHARAPYVIFVEPEDELHRNALEYMSLKLDEYPEDDMFTCETECFGDDSYGRTNRDRKQIIADSNTNDNRRLETDNRLMRSWIFDGITMYRTDFLRDNGISHYEVPGYGKQNDAFQFLALVKGVPSLSVEVLYERRMDVMGHRITDAGTVTDVCDEFRFLEERLKEDRNLWWKYRLVFWQAYYDRNMLHYERLSDNLRSRLSKRMQADIKNAIYHKEYSADHFDIAVRDEMELLLKSTDDFDRYQADRLRKREQERTQALAKEERLSELFHEETEIERISRETAEHMKQMQRENRLDKKWLKDEMARDMAPLRMLLGLSAEEMSNILGVSGATYKNLEAGKKEVSWDQYMALLFVFRFNDRMAPVTDTLGLYPEPLQKRIKKGIIFNYG